MVSRYQRIKQKVSLVFQPARETTREIVSQIPGVDVTRPIKDVPEAPGFKAVPPKPPPTLPPSGNGKPSAPPPKITAPPPTPPPVSKAPPLPKRDGTLAGQFETTSGQFRVRGEQYTRQQLINLGLGGDVIKQRPGESRGAFESRLISYGRGIAEADPTSARTFTKGGAAVSGGFLYGVEEKERDILKDIAKAGREGEGKELQRLRKELRITEDIQKRIGGVSFVGGRGTVTKPTIDTKGVYDVLGFTPIPTGKIDRKIDTRLWGIGGGLGLVGIKQPSISFREAERYWERVKPLSTVEGTGKIILGIDGLGLTIPARKTIALLRKYYSLQTEELPSELEVQPVTKPAWKTSPLQRSSIELEMAESKLYRYQKRKDTGFGGRAISGTGGLILGGAGAIVGGIGAFAHPFQTTKGLKYAVTHPLETGEILGKRLEERPEAFFGEVIGTVALPYGVGKVSKYVSPITGRVIQKLPFVKEPKITTPTLLQESLTQPFTRQRATLLLKDIKGRYILGETKGGQRISIGGGIEKGQTPKTAALRELYEETGLRLKDIKGFKKRGKYVFPEETHYVFTGVVKDVSKIKPASDVSKIFYLKPSKAKIRGQTPWYPIAKGKVRSYELGIIKSLETGKKPTWLFAETKQGKFYLGTQSRYNVPFKYGKRYLKEKDLLLAHATPSGRIGFFRRKLSIDPFKTKRGADKGLYLQPPTSLKTTTFFERRGYYLKKAVGKPTGLFRKKGVVGGEGYVGLSYADLIGVPQKESLGLKIGWRRRTVYTLKEQPKYPITPTKKAILGKESELILKEGIAKRAGRAESIWMAGRRVRFQPIKIVRDIELKKLSTQLYKKGITLTERKTILKKLRKKTGIDYSEEFGGYKYVSPIEISSPLFRKYPKRKDYRYGKQPRYKIAPYGKRIDYRKIGYGYKGITGRTITPPYYYSPSEAPSGGITGGLIIPPDYYPPGKPPKRPPVITLPTFGFPKRFRKTTLVSRKFFKPRYKYQPSLTGSVFKIKGKPKKIKGVGYLPTIRGI